MSLEKYKIYDEIIKFFNSYPSKMESDFRNKFLHASPSKHQTKEQRLQVVERQNEYREAFSYLLGAGYIEKQKVYYKLSPSGTEKTLKGFEQEYLEKERKDSLVETNLIETTELSRAQREDIRKSNKKSNIALILSVVTFLTATGFEIYKAQNDIGDYEEHRNTYRNPPIDNRGVTEIKDSTDKTSELIHSK